MTPVSRGKARNLNVLEKARNLNALEKAQCADLRTFVLRGRGPPARRSRA